MTDEMQFPPIKCCPSCGSEDLVDRLGMEQDYEKKTGRMFAECANCGCHFSVHGFYQYVLPGEGTMSVDDGTNDKLDWIMLDRIAKPPHFKCEMCGGTQNVTLPVSEMVAMRFVSAHRDHVPEVK